MPLSAGTCLGPYEILAPIGAGAMGEVYRARDTKLDRAVAIKVLPDQDERGHERARGATKLHLGSQSAGSIVASSGAAAICSIRRSRWCFVTDAAREDLKSRDFSELPANILARTKRMAFLGCSTFVDRNFQFMF